MPKVCGSIDLYAWLNTFSSFWLIAPSPGQDNFFVKCTEARVIYPVKIDGVDDPRLTHQLFDYNDTISHEY